ncbi:MAG TPA: IS110 family transposase [Steroidobacteraceae bacterium]|jgi:transposase|nr:IS110 family transposase [Steroidobacteraceae bacterium]
MRHDITAFVGLDVHKEAIAIAVADPGRAPPRFLGTVRPALAPLEKALGHLGSPAQLGIVYEAGPCGYGLARRLLERGYRCEVVAPGKIPRRPGQRIKTDRRDALSLASFARSAELTPVLIPDERDEAMRDLARTREDAVRARLKARQQLKAMLLRHGHHYSGRIFWSAAHQRDLAKVSFPHPAQQIAFTEYCLAVTEADERVTRLSAALREQAGGWRLQPWLGALMTLRGLQLVTAATVLAELGDLRRFPHPKQLMSFLGLVPSECSSGLTRHLGAITKCGNAHIRRVLIEAAWSYRHPARLSRELQIRQQGQPKAVRDIAWKAQLRLCARYRRLHARGLHQNKICIAIARELAGFIWDIARHVPIAS